MNLLTINLKDKLIAQNRRALLVDSSALTHQSRLDAQIEKLRLGAESSVTQSTADLVRELGFSYLSSAAVQVAEINSKTSHLAQDRVFDESAIQDLCVTYGLRFLGTEVYQGELDRGLPAAVEAFKAEDKGINSCGSRGYRYRIAAPSAAFALQDRPAPDPLLFAELPGNKCYLVHQWGQDLSVGARVANWHWRAISTTGWAVAAILAMIWAFSRVNGGTNGSAVGVFMAALVLGLFGTLVLAHAPIPFFQRRVTRANWRNQYKD